MDTFQQRLPQSLMLVLLTLVTCFMWVPVAAQDDDAALKYKLEKSDDDISISEALKTTFPRQLRNNMFIYPKDTEQEVNGPIYAKDAEGFMIQLEDTYNLLVLRQGDRFHIYCPDDPSFKEHAASEPINYVYMCRQSRAADLVTSLKLGKPLGFPQANALKGDGKGSFVRHDSPIPASTKAEDKNPTKEGEISPGTTFQLTLDNGILITGPLPDVRNAVQKLKALDRRTRVVLIEVLIVQYFHDDQFSWRFNLQDGALLKADPPKFSSGFTQPTTITGPNTFGPQPWGIDFQNLAFNPATGATSLAYSGIGSLTSQFKQNLTFLASENLARIVTNPHIAVINGQSGQVLLNEKFNFLNAVVTPTGTVAQTSDSLNSLTSINVTPTIVGPDSVHVAVNTTLATFSGVSTVESSLPGQRINELGTSVILDDDETLILGGLVKEEVTESRSKIPGLAKIPLIGHLFRGKDQNRRFSETVVYIIPKLYEKESLERRYRDRVFKHYDETKVLGEEIRARHRWDKYDSKRMYHYNEKMDKIERGNLRRELYPKLNWLHRGGHAGQAAEDTPHGSPTEVIPPGTRQLHEPTETELMMRSPANRPQDGGHAQVSRPWQEQPDQRQFERGSQRPSEIQSPLNQRSRYQPAQPEKDRRNVVHPANYRGQTNWNHARQNGQIGVPRFAEPTTRRYERNDLRPAESQVPTYNRYQQQPIRSARAESVVDSRNVRMTPHSQYPYQQTSGIRPGGYAHPSARHADPAVPRFERDDRRSPEIQDPRYDQHRKQPIRSTRAVSSADSRNIRMTPHSQYPHQQTNGIRPDGYTRPSARNEAPAAPRFERDDRRFPEAQDLRYDRRRQQPVSTTSVVPRRTPASSATTTPPTSRREHESRRATSLVPPVQFGSGASLLGELRPLSLNSDPGYAKTTPSRHEAAQR